MNDFSRIILNINKRAKVLLKSSLGCYQTTAERVFEGFFCNKTLYLDFGLKYKIFLEQEKENDVYELHDFKIRMRETPFDDSFFCLKFLKEQNDYNRFLRNLLRIKEKKTIVRGRILNRIKGGYAVGCNSWVGFLPKSKSYKCKVGSAYAFSILTLKVNNFSFVIGRKRSILKRKKWKKILQKKVIRTKHTLYT